MSLRNTLKPLALFVGATFAIAPLASFADDLPVKIGFAAPLTGANAGYGKDLENGVRLAIEEANAQKIKIGDKVAQFEIVSEDDQADPRILSVQAAQKLVTTRAYRRSSATSIRARRFRRRRCTSRPAFRCSTRPPPIRSLPGRGFREEHRFMVISPPTRRTRRQRLEASTPSR